MSTIKRAVGAGILATFALASLPASLPAFAADLGGAPHPRWDGTPRGDYRPMRLERWTGLYLGGALGYGMGTADVTGGSGMFDLDTDGTVATLFAGYNWQAGSAVFGLEADIGTGWIDDASGFGPALVSQELNMLGSLRARAGFLVSPAFLVYGTAGFAFADFDFHANGITKSETLLGYQVGGGTELMISPNWTLRMEYIYTGLGEETVNHGGIVNTYDPDFHTVRAGLSFKF